MSNIMEVLTANKYLANIGKGMSAAGLGEELSKKGPFTVFAPTDLAFGKLQSGEWPDLLKSENKAELLQLMNNYVVNGKETFKDLKNGQKLKTLGGTELSVKVTEGKVDINGARIQGRDMEASNGVVHSIDTISLTK